jgi:hypothetical protein
MILLGRPQKSDLVQVNNLNLLLIGTAIFLIVSNWVFMGVYLKLDNKSILIGFMLCYREILVRKQNQQPTEPKTIA